MYNIFTIDLIPVDTGAQLRIQAALTEDYIQSANNPDDIEHLPAVYRIKITALDARATPMTSTRLDIRFVCNGQQNSVPLILDGQQKVTWNVNEIHTVSTSSVLGHVILILPIQDQLAMPTIQVRWSPNQLMQHESRWATFSPDVILMHKFKDIKASHLRQPRPVGLNREEVVFLDSDQDAETLAQELRATMGASLQAHYATKPKSHLSKRSQVDFVAPISEYNIENEIIEPVWMDDMPTVRVFPKFHLQKRDFLHNIVNGLKSVGKTVRDAFTGLRRTLIRFRRGVTQLVHQVVALFDWSSILRTTMVMDTHIRKMITYLRVNLIDRREVLVDRASNLFQNLTQQLKNPSEFRLPKVGEELHAVFNGTTSASANNTKSPTIQEGIVHDAVVTHLSQSKTLQKSLLGFLDVINSFVHGLSSTTVKSTELKSIGNYLKQIPQVFNNGLNLEAFQKLGGIFEAVFVLIGSYAADAAVRALITVYQALLTVYETVMLTRVRLPLITPLYEKVITKGQQKLTLMGVLCLCAALPVTIGYKISHSGDNIFTSEESYLLRRVKSPRNYIAVWESLEEANNNNSTLPKSTRRSKVTRLSYMAGGIYSSCQMLAFTIAASPLPSYAVGLLQLPLLITAQFSNFPFHWYSNRINATAVQEPQEIDIVNIRVLSWFYQMVPALMGGHQSVGTQMTGGATFGRALHVILAIVPLISLTYQKANAELPFLTGRDRFDALTRHTAAVFTYVPEILALFSQGNVIAGSFIASLYLTSGALQMGRLQMSMATNAIYSV